MGDDAAAGDLARGVNELSAKLIQDRPDRSGGFASLPLPDVDGALRALEYGLDVLKLDGVVLFSNARGIYLGDARFRPLFDELERRGTVVFVHPTSSPDAAARTLGLPDSLIDFTADTTRPVAQMHRIPPLSIGSSDGDYRNKSGFAKDVPLLGWSCLNLNPRSPT
jgi:6-methylsalicylate decarboxylase